MRLFSDQKGEKEVLILDLNEIPLLVQAEVAQTPIEEVQVRIHLTQEEEVAEVEVLETKKSLALSSKKPIKSDINLFYSFIITQ